MKRISYPIILFIVVVLEKRLKFILYFAIMFVFEIDKHNLLIFLKFDKKKSFIIYIINKRYNNKKSIKTCIFLLVNSIKTTSQ